MGREDLPEEVESVNRPITSGGVETVIEDLATGRGPGLGGFTGEFCHLERS